MLSEADTCRKFITPKLQEAGWDAEPHSLAEQRAITDGRVILVGDKAQRRQPKRPDYLLRYTTDFTIAVVEAKSIDKQPTAGSQQAKEYALMLGLQFAYSTNGDEIVEFNFSTGMESRLTSFPTPDELWQRFRALQGIKDDAVASRFLTRCFGLSDKKPRFTQEIAINRAIQAILQGKKRVLLKMATGTCKTFVAFQICWKLWDSRWNRTGDHRRPHILYLADRNILIDDPKDKMFVPFGDARHRVENGATKPETITDWKSENSKDIPTDDSGKGIIIGDGFGQPRRKHYFEDGQVEIVTDVAYKLTPNTGKQLRVVKYTDDAAKQVRIHFTDSPALQDGWANPEQRTAIRDMLAARDMDYGHLQEVAKLFDVDLLDLIRHLTFNALFRTCRERAKRLKNNRKDFFEQYRHEARAILEKLLEKYAAHGPEQLQLPEVLQVPPISTHGNVMEIADNFRGAEKLRNTVSQLQALLYAA